jgi:predicted nucleic acid-binding protein
MCYASAVIIKVVGDADFLVTGDKILLVLEEELNELKLVV